MKSPNNHPTNFWFGFAVGTVSTVIAAYFLGTKKGREHLKKIMDLSENIEELSPTLISEAQNLIGSYIVPSDKDISAEGPKESPVKTHTLDTLLDKIKNSTQSGKYVKKFFAKSGKLEDST